MMKQENKQRTSVSFFIIWMLLHDQGHTGRRIHA